MLTTHLYFSAEFKNKWSHTSIPPVYVYGEYNDKLIFTFTVRYLCRNYINIFAKADNPFY